MLAPVMRLLHLSLCALAAGALMLSVSARAADADWIDPKLLPAAKAEGSLVVYSSINEEEALALWKGFEEATGIKVDYVGGADVQIIARVMIEVRSGRKTWDLMQTPSVHKLPPQVLAQVDLPEAQHGLPQARDPDRRWQGVTAIYQAPGYNSKLVNVADLPKSHEELARRTQWAGHVAINDNDSEWVASLLQFYGEDKGRALIKTMVETLKPVMVSGHLALARAVAAGEYWVALSNYAHLTTNVKLGGGPTDFFALDPVGIFFNEVGVAAQAPHPNAARLAANYLLSKPAQEQLKTRGRVPIRLDVETNPPGMLKPLLAKKLAPVVLSAEQEKKADALFKELIAGRGGDEKIEGGNACASDCITGRVSVSSISGSKPSPAVPSSSSRSACSRAPAPSSRRSASRSTRTSCARGSMAARARRAISSAPCAARPLSGRRAPPPRASSRPRISPALRTSRLSSTPWLRQPAARRARSASTRRFSPSSAISPGDRSSFSPA